jgi:hypothetical protein
MQNTYKAGLQVSGELAASAGVSILVVAGESAQVSEDVSYPSIVFY